MFFLFFTSLMELTLLYSRVNVQITANLFISYTNDNGILQGTLRDLSKRNHEHSLPPVQQACFKFAIPEWSFFKSLWFNFFPIQLRGIDYILWPILPLMSRLTKVMNQTVGLPSPHHITIMLLSLMMISERWYLIVEFCTQNVSHDIHWR